MNILDFLCGKVLDFRMSTDPSPDRRFPSAECKASAIDNVTTFARCEVQEPVHCRYTLSFPYTRLCLHPQSQEIVERTKKGKSK